MRIDPRKFNIIDNLSQRTNGVDKSGNRIAQRNNVSIENTGRARVDRVEINSRRETDLGGKRVEELKNAVANNTYKVDSRRVIGAMLKEAFTERFIK